MTPMLAQAFVNGDELVGHDERNSSTNTTLTTGQRRANGTSDT
jgi:hypothetical protein